MALNRKISKTNPDESSLQSMDLRLAKVKKAIARKAFAEAIVCLDQAMVDAPAERIAECMSLKGFSYYQLGEMEKAEQSCSAAIEGDWENPDTFAWRAASRGEQNKWRLAFNDLHRACELTAPDSDRYLGLMDQYSVAAKEYFHEQAKSPSPSADVFCDRGWMYLRQGSLRKAERDFKLALSIDIDHRWSALGLAKTHYQAGVSQHLEALLVAAASPKAEVACRRSAYELSARINHQAGLIAATDSDLHRLYRLAGKDCRPKIQCCRLRAELGFPIRSIDILSKIIKTSPESTIARLVRGECYTAVKNYSYAIKDFTHFLTVHSDHVDALLGRAKALLGIQRFPLVHQDLERVLELAPDKYEAVLLQAKTFLAQEQLEAALTSCQLATRLETLPEGFAVKAEIYHKLYRFSESFEEYSRAIELARESDQKAEYLYRRGTSLYELNYFQDAYLDFKKSCELRPHHAGSWVWKSAASARLGKWHASVIALKHAIDARPTAADAYRKIGYPIALKAIKRFDKTIQKAPDTPRIYRYRAMAHQFLGNHEDAVRDFTAARRRNPDSLEILVHRSQALSELEDHELARADLTKVINKSPRHHAALYGRAVALSALGLEAEACADLKNAIEIDHNCAKYYLLLAQLYLRSGQTKQATRAFDEAITRDSTDADSYHQRARVYLSMKRYRRAIRDYSTAIELATGKANIIEQRGQAYLEDGQPDLALEDFESALALDAQAVCAYRGRATILVSRGMHEYVLIWLTKALHRFDNEDLADMLISRGKVFAQMGRWIPAIGDFTAAIDLVRHRPPMLFAARQARGLANIHCGRYEVAAKDFRQIKKLVADDSALAKTMDRTNYIDQIFEWLERVELDPGLPRPAILGPPVPLKAPLRPAVIRQGIVLDDVTIERFQNESPFNTWVVQTPDEKDFGPVHFEILRGWLADGRLDVGTRLLRADWSKWELVEQLFSDMLPANGDFESTS